VRDSGTYALVIITETKISLRAGGLGTHRLPPGYYVYVGSALNGLSGRLKRHLRLEKKLHWHVDYLLQEAAVAQIWYTLGQDKLECRWNEIMMNLPGATSSIRGFGASDCPCFSHLTYFPAVPSFNLFKQKLRQRKLPQVYQLDLTV
jgi:Uri superfamily endonuclease